MRLIAAIGVLLAGLALSALGRVGDHVFTYELNDGGIADGGASDAHIDYVPTVHILGDSLSFGINSTSGSGYRPYVYDLALAAQPCFFLGFYLDPPPVADPYNTGVPGIKIEDSESYFYQNFQYVPDIVLLELGTNNISGGDSSATVVSKLSGALDMLFAETSKPWFRVVMMNILERYDSTALNDVGVAVNSALPAMIAAKSYASRVYLVDWYSGADGNYGSNTVHPDEAGYALLAPIIYGQLSLAISAVVLAHQ